VVLALQTAVQVVHLHQVQQEDLEVVRELMETAVLVVAAEEDIQEVVLPLLLAMAAAAADLIMVELTRQTLQVFRQEMVW